MQCPRSLCGNEKIDKDVSICLPPLNGAGLKCVTRCLKENGFTNISVVAEQEHPDGNFPTCPYPNPEIREALELGLRDAKSWEVICFLQPIRIVIVWVLLFALVRSYVL